MPYSEEYKKEIFEQNKEYYQRVEEAPWPCSNRCPTTRVVRDTQEQMDQLKEYIENNAKGRYFYTHYDSGDEIFILFENSDDYKLIERDLMATYAQGEPYERMKKEGYISFSVYEAIPLNDRPIGGPIYMINAKKEIIRVENDGTITNWKLVKEE